eukprot:TRINITY_DN43601_c0_g1_i1.p1 TRINITY_DN43601_c0_g1~~TRINITY_DN43601_c0_g1_i1.p1  ORF type:complete len:923 (-),score=157.24 TRINITY_DN43601_c0_g1_i1:31-2799(-)
MYQRLLEGQDDPGPNRGWDAAPDLERFLTSFYRYFEVGGKGGILAIHISHLTSLAFTIGFSFLLLFVIDWQALLSCDSEETCRAVSLCYQRPFAEPGLWRLAVLLSFILFLAYWICNAVAALQQIRDAYEMRAYFKDRLNIPSDEILGTMAWSEVVARLIRQQKSSRFCIVQDQITALEIANIILREDNFMVAFANHDVFTSRLPPWIPPRLVYTRAALWNIRTAIFHWMFDPRSRIRGEFLNNPSLLARRFRWMGIMNVVLVVPVLMFVTIYFFMRHAEEFRSHRTSPFQRQWTDYAQWTFREFGELPHHFALRLCNARVAAENFTSTARPATPFLTAFQRCVKFIAGSILAVLLLVALWDDTPLLFVKIHDKNLLWYLAFFGFVFAVADNAADDSPRAGRTSPPNRSGGNTGSSGVGASGATGLGGAGGTGSKVQLAPLRSPSAPLRMYIAMMDLVRCTHYLPPPWRSPEPVSVLAGGSDAVQRAGLCTHFAKVRSDFLRNMFVHRIQVLVEELLGVVLAPLLLIVYLPKAAPDIIDIVRRTQHPSPNLGDWCVFGCLDPASNGSEFYGGGPSRSCYSRGNQFETTGAQATEAHTFDSGSGGGGAVAAFDERAPPGAAAFRSRSSCENEYGFSGRLVSNGGKLEKSVISFIHAHSFSWKAECDTDDIGVVRDGRSGVGETSDRGAKWRSIGLVPPLANVAAQAVASVVDLCSAAASSCSGIAEDRPAQRLPNWTASDGRVLSQSVRSVVDTQGRNASDDHTTELCARSQEAHGVNCGREDNDVDAQTLAAPAELSSRDVNNGVDEEFLQWHAEGPPESLATHAAPPKEDIWGYPSSASHFMSELEDFRCRELAAHRDFYGSLPDDLLACRPWASPASASSQPPSSSMADEEVEESGCGAQFFWLEVLYDSHSCGIGPSYV